MKRAALVLVLAACPAPAPRPPVVISNHYVAPPPPPPGPVSGLVAKAQGHWHGVDDDGWIYDLAVHHDHFTQHVIQAGGTACDQAGKITEEDGKLVRTFDSNSCNEAYVNNSVHDGVESADPEHLVLRMESDYLIRYDRAP